MKPIDIVFLGTSCSNPTTQRHLTSTAFRYDGTWFLIDTAENVQKQMLHSGISYMRVQYIFFSHFHLDHFLGLAGLLATMSLHNRQEELTIFGPRNLKQKIQQTLDLADLQPTFPLDLQEIKKDTDIIQKQDFTVRAFLLDHTTPTLGYSFTEKDKLGEFDPKKAEALKIPRSYLWQQLQNGETIEHNGKKIKPEQVLDTKKAKKGRKISIILDTFSSDSYKQEIKDSDILIHESSFIEKDRKRAEETKHSIAADVAKLAAQSNIKKLYLTHISPRYSNPKEIENEAKQYFKNSYLAKDLQQIILK